MWKLGDVAFFKRAKKLPERKSPEAEFKGYGFGVFLGHVSPFQKAPPAASLFRLMADAGYVSFDDISAFLGEEVCEKLIKDMQAKYLVDEVPEPKLIVPESLNGREPKTAIIDDPEPPKLEVVPPAPPKEMDFAGRVAISVFRDALAVGEKIFIPEAALQVAVKDFNRPGKIPTPAAAMAQEILERRRDEVFFREAAKLFGNALAAARNALREAMAGRAADEAHATFAQVDELARK